MKIHQQFQCESCKRLYTTPELALACEAQKMAEPIAKAGDIVTAGAGFGWFNGDPAWVANYEQLAHLRVDAKHGLSWSAGDHPISKHGKCPNGDSNCFGPCCTYQFYYVVGTVEMRPEDEYASKGKVYDKGPYTHRWAYHLFTLAMRGNDSAAKSGWTTPGSHITPVIVENPPELPGARDFVGRRSERLL